MPRPFWLSRPAGNDVPGIGTLVFGSLSCTTLPRMFGGLLVSNSLKLPVAHQRGGHGPGGGVEEAVSHPFLTPIPEELALVLVQFAGDVEWTADIEPKLVVVERQHGAVGKQAGDVRGVVARPGVGVEHVVTGILVGGAVELLAAALGKMRIWPPEVRPYSAA